MTIGKCGASQSSAVVIVNRQPPIVNLLLLCDSDFELRGDVAVQLDWYGRRAERLERFGELDLPAIDLETVRRQRLGEIRRRHRAVELLGVADAPRDRQLELRDAGGQRLGG